MRISALIVILLWGMVSPSVAGDSSRQGSSPAAATNSFSADWSNPSAIGGHDFVKLPAPDRSDEVYRGFNQERDGELFCLKMHVFEVKRESPHSDVTEPRAQWTCQRASKYSVKTTEEPDNTPLR